MKFGVCVPNYGNNISPDGLIKFAKLAEELGYDSVWSTDHILLSKGSNTPYENIFESIGTLFYIASKTEKVKVGVSSLVMALRNPVIIAKELATLDNFSSGRVMLATGAGWNEEEFNNLGADFHHRGIILDESIRLIRMLWESKGSPVNFDGKYFRIKEGIFCCPTGLKELTRVCFLIQFCINLTTGWHVPNTIDHCDVTASASTWMPRLLNMFSLLLLCQVGISFIPTPIFPLREIMPN